MRTLKMLALSFVAAATMAAGAAPAIARPHDDHRGRGHEKHRGYDNHRGRGHAYGHDRGRGYNNHRGRGRQVCRIERHRGDARRVCRWVR